MSVKAWTLPPARPIVDNRPSKAQILGILVVGLLLGLLLAWAGLQVAESQRQPDPLNESGPWQVLAPSAGGQLEISDFSGDRGRLSTGCGQFPYSYTQSGTSLTFTALPPAPKGCVGPAAQSHTWFVGELAEVASFTPADFWQDTPTITLLDASRQPSLTLTIDANPNRKTTD